MTPPPGYSVGDYDGRNGQWWPFTQHQVSGSSVTNGLTTHCLCLQPLYSAIRNGLVVLRDEKHPLSPLLIGHLVGYMAHVVGAGLPMRRVIEY